MALTLKTAITATETTVDILGADAINDGDVFEIGSEYVAIQGDPGEPARQLGVAYFRRANFKRGVQGTAEAAHAAGAGMTQKLPGAGGTSDHTALDNLDTADQHPIAAVEGLEAALAAALSVPAAHVVPETATPQAIAEALIAAGLMEGAP